MGGRRLVARDAKDVRGLYCCLWYARGLCLCLCVITPGGFTSLPTGGGVWFFGFYKQTNKKTNECPNFENFDCKWSWYHLSSVYHSSILDFLELHLRRVLEHNVQSSLPNPLFQRDKDGRAAATAATLPRPFCC